MTEIKIVPNQAVVCVNDKKYLDELVKLYSDKCRTVEVFNYKDDFLLLTSKSPVDYAELREGVPYEKARYITPVYKGNENAAFLKAEVVVKFKNNNLSETELNEFLKKTGLSLKRKGVCSYLFGALEADGEKTLEVIERVKKEENVDSANPNYLQIVKSPDVSRKRMR